MPITFVAADTLSVEAINAVIYGPPGAGKTSLALTAADPVLLDFDMGVQRAVGREGKPVARISRWSEVEQLSREDLADYKTIVVDTVGRALDRLAEDIIAKNPKHGAGGALSLQGYGQLKSRFAQWLRSIQGYGMDVVLVAHATEEQRGEDHVDRIDAAGSSKNLVYQSADLMGRLAPQQGGIVYDPRPTPSGFGKSPGLEPYLIPLGGADTMARIIGDAKRAMSAINSASDAEANRWQELREWWAGTIEQGEDAVADEVLRIGDEDRDTKMAYHRMLTDAGYLWLHEEARYAQSAA